VGSRNNAYANLVPFDAENRHRDVVADVNGFAFASCEDEHL
jgi:hypothetical protein